MLVAVLGVLVAAFAAPAGAGVNASAHYYAGDLSPKDSYGTADAVWSGRPAYGPGHTGQPGDYAFSVDADRALALSDPGVGNYGTQDFTVHLWVKLTGDAADRYDILSKRASCGYVSFFDLRAFGTSQLYAEVQDSSNGGFHVTVPVNVLDDRWHEITVKRAGTTFLVTADSQTASAVTNGVVSFDSDAPWAFGDGACVTHGSTVGDGTLRASGLIDDVSFGPGRAIVRPPTPSPTPASPPTAAGSASTAPAVVPGTRAPMPTATRTARASTSSTARPPSPPPASAVLSAPAGTTTQSPSAAASPASAAAGGPSPPIPSAPPPAVGGSLTPAGGARLEAAVRAHRVSVLPLSLRTPETVATDAKSVGENVLIALLALVAVGFSAQVANKAFIENYDEIMDWTARLRNRTRRAEVYVDGVAGWAALGLFGLASATIHGLIDPHFGFDRASLALALGLTVAFLVLTCAWELPLSWSLHNRTDERRSMRLFVGSIPIGVLCVVISRVGHIQPGYLIGVCAAVVPVDGNASDRERGRGVFLCAVFTIGSAVAAWCWSVPVDRAVTHAIEDHGNAPFGLLVLQAALTATVVAGLECAVFGLLPMTFVKGVQVVAWSRAWWAVAFTVAVFGLLHLVLHPAAGTEGSVRADITTWLPLPVVVVASVAFWAWFRKRVRDRERMGPAIDASAS